MVSASYIRVTVERPQEGKGKCHSRARRFQGTFVKERISAKTHLHCQGDSEDETFRGAHGVERSRSATLS